MDTFIKKYEYNYIKKALSDMKNHFINCTDPNIIETTKAYTQDKILNFFTNLSHEERDILNISKITDPSHIDIYLKDLNQYVYGMPNITDTQISKLFKKEKKLKLPDSHAQDSKLVYLGWIDSSIRKLLIAYNMDGKLIGMACRLQSSTSNNTNICTLCNHIGSENEVAFVSPVCKTSNQGTYGYKSIGFNICLDSAQCNDRIISTEKLEELLKAVNNIE
ncbi:FusB/FusC family EF-G-binding protein [Clostridium sp. LP20]|uniref:FusB/FusC family EF-G-binding protein n=1 Tax=Clostridium sp. LP20 TaxID=3418665 RepID=UPI003EE5A3BD